MRFLRRLLSKRAPALIDDDDWRRTLERYPFMSRLSPDELSILRTRTDGFIEAKSFTGVQGLRLNEDIVVAIAAQACLPVLHLGIDAFGRFDEIVVYPDEFHVQREMSDEDGVVHDVSGPLSGETMPGGPVVLSWRDAQSASTLDAYNVVVHEFAHKLDMADGFDADGVPPLHPRLHAGLDRERWIDVLDEAFELFRDMLDAFEDSFPANLDPESEAGRALYARLPLDAYAAQDPAEFFAVASEVYFVAPARLQAAFPSLFDLLDRYYRPSSSMERR